MPAGIKSLRQYLKFVDIVLEVADARLPAASRYPDLGTILGNRTRILVLTRADLADPVATARWLEVFQAGGTPAVAVNARTGEGVRALRQQMAGTAKEKRGKLAQKGLRARPLRVMALGIPNVGKSSLLNRLAGRGAARTGDRPGITRGPQWIRIEGNMELLDTPGVLWSHWQEPGTALWLGAIGCAPEGILPVTEIANLVGEFLLGKAPEVLVTRYGITRQEAEGANLLEAIGRRRGYLLPGGIVDQEKTALALVNDFRAGYLGRFTLELP
ncbi:ribosome biogenesis GTPase YlqF [Neomoorella mulderi]|uniref:Ribosome biogenesis GTPase A n=1 Tax=Moorella mulderi DSM 14980 TaxID=1122241 RepID=A0A151AWR3_9FIRM|nr:ribosome biogenesis GTPase YlqF [Moorella mulderi]KYH32078.1 ribosome biogenesis GTPase A [Moorella mulderi DSM 14980]